MRREYTLGANVTISISPGLTSIWVWIPELGKYVWSQAFADDKHLTAYVRKEASELIVAARKKNIPVYKKVEA
jgi:hypothetical protein